MRTQKAYLAHFVIVVLLLFPLEAGSQPLAIEKVDYLNINYIFNDLNKITLQEFCITKNHHSPHNRRIIFHKSNEFSIVCMFDESCLYSFDDERSKNAINKIFGYSFGYYHHNNSFRLGWRCKDKKIEILAYWYIKHKHYSQHLFFIDPGKRFLVNVKTDYKKVTVKYLSEDLQIITRDILFNPDNVKLSRWGYINYPYFGGRRKAPHNMSLHMKVWLTDTTREELLAGQEG